MGSYRVSVSTELSRLTEEGDEGLSRSWGDGMPAQDPKRRRILPSWDWSRGCQERRLTPAPTSVMAS